MKDVYAEDALVVHLSETVIGDGAYDVAGFVRRFRERCPAARSTSSTSRPPLVPRAKTALDALLAARP